MTWSDRLPALLLLGFALAACGREPQGFLLLPLVQAKSYAVGEASAGLSFASPPELRVVEIDHERRPAVLTTPAPWRWRGRVPPGARLHVGLQTLPAAWGSFRRLEARVVVHDGSQREVLEVARTPEGQAQRWLDFGAGLERYAGREVTLEFAVSLVGLAAGRQSVDRIAWGPVVLSAGPAEPPARRRPNVLFILVDTLRHDHLTLYGYRRDTSPEIALRLAATGAVVEDAYSQAPWTLPSAISYMTGRYPGELVGPEIAAFGIPDEVPTLPERMAALDYETGGFIANPSLHPGLGFGRGFRTLYVPPADSEWFLRHADDLNAHVLPWVAAHQDRPFFLYVHYIDPHDPYLNPDLLGHRSPFMPDYSGPIAGDWVHGIYAGKLQLGDPEQDVAHIRALYDSEIRYVDRHIGELLAAFDPRVLAETLVVLTADHGEELYEHGGWKHGQTLYEEQIHVPLIFRWDGRIPAGRRLAGTVSLLDLMPTLIAAAGGKPDPAWDGIDLLPALTGKGPLPRRVAFAEHLSGGPLRAAAVMDRRKLVLFNPREDFAPADDLQSHLWRLDLERLEREELYDLGRDPGEKVNLAHRPGAQTANTSDAERLAPIIHGQLGRELPGLWVIAAGSPAAPRLGGSIVFERPPARWIPYFLGPGDRVELAGNRLRFELSAGRLEKGFRVEGSFGAVLAVEARRDGEPLPPSGVRVGPGRPYGGGALRLEALRAPGWPAAADRGALWLGLPAGRTEAPRAQADPETERRLRALGYLNP